MVTYDDIVKDVCQREIENGCYDVKIDNVDIYNYVKRDFRNKALSLYGLEEKGTFISQSKWIKIKAIFISFCQLCKIIITHKRFTNCIYSFRRVDKVDGIYVEKFTDPLVDNSTIKDSYIVLEAGRDGLHSKPRCHDDRIMYVEFINAMAIFWSRVFVTRFKNKNSVTFSQLFKNIDKAFPDNEYTHNEVFKTVYYGILKSKFYTFFFKKIQCKRLIAPSRSDFQVMIPAARNNKMMVVELQHGITYSESVTYSGFRSFMFTPDIFLAFGEMTPKNVYGIEERKIHNIGFAFLDYIKDCLSSKKTEEGGALLISEPEVTSKMISVALKLAEKYPSITFSFRPHPMEQLSNEQLERIKSVNNIVIDDNTQNIMVSLTQYKHVIGENSTVLYEALSFGCVVGKLKMEGLSPKYLEESDKSLFFEINNVDDFWTFYNCSKVNDKVRHIYSPYNREKFEELIKIYNYE